MTVIVPQSRESGYGRPLSFARREDLVLTNSLSSRIFIFLGIATDERRRSTARNPESVETDNTVFRARGLGFRVLGQARPSTVVLPSHPETV
jgi:hypothetical protein